MEKTTTDFYFKSQLLFYSKDWRPTVLNVKKTFTKILIITLIFNIFITFSYGEFVEIYEERSSENISKGVVHEKILRFTNQGWLNMNILRIDLDDKYTSLDVLTSEKGISGRDSLSGLASKNPSADKIIGAINGDFYDTKAFSTIGPIVKDGELITSSKNSPDFATFNLDIDNNPFIEYWGTNYQKLINVKTNFILDIDYKNKSYINEGVILLDKNWGDFSFGNENHEDIVEMVVDNNKVKEIRDNLEAIEIPQDGYIIVATGPRKEYILNNFSKNNIVSLDIASNPNFETLSLSMGGGAVILKDGNIPEEFSLNIRGKHPRTALGISRDKKEIIMLTIDGRNPSYPGVTQRELAEILFELGAYDGINLDGGGSTGMVVRPSGEEKIVVSNEPSGGFQRRIMNGLAVLNNSPRSSLKGIKIDCDDSNIFLGTSRNFTIKGYDKNYNPIQIDPTKAAWSVKGIEGKFVDNRFIPETSGRGTIEVYYNGKTSAIDIMVLNNPVKLEISPSKIYGEAKKEVPLHVEATNDEGYRAKIDSRDLIWSIPDNIGEIRNNAFIASNKLGADILKASFKDVNAYVQVSTGYREVILENFERMRASFLPYPDDVSGDFELSSKEKTGSSSGKLIYDFTNALDSKAAYVVFDNGGLHMEEKPEKLGLWVHGSKGNGHWLRGKLKDANDNSFSLTFERYVDWDGWKFVETDIPWGAVAPLTLERLYLVEIEPRHRDSGQIYLDDITAFYKSKVNKGIPEDTVIYSDKRNVSAELKNENSFRFLAHGAIANIDTLLDNLVVNKLSNISNTMDLSLFTNYLDNGLKDKLSTNYEVIHSGYSHTKLKNSSFIKLNNNDNGSIRATDFNQWIWLLDVVKNIDSDSLFITLPKPLGFKDKLEEKLFFDTFKKLREEKNIDVWILSGGSNKDFEVDVTDGIRLVKLKSYPDHNNIDIFHELKYMVFTVNDGYVTYEIKNMYGK